MTPSGIPFAPLVRWDVPPGTILATYTDASVVVWQAHGDAVADHALATGRFGGPAWRDDRVTRFRLSLPSLLCRCEWASRPGRERILAVHLRRSSFDELLRRAIPAEFDPAAYASTASWRLATRFATATVSWHPDCSLQGEHVPWQTPRFGVRDQALQAFATEWVVGIEDATDWVRAHRDAAPGLAPVVRPYPREGDGVR